MFSQERYKFLLNAPFEISSKCCKVMKKTPTHAYARKTGRKPITAQMASESRLRSQQWLKNGCNGFDMKSPISNPMAFWTEQDVLLYIDTFITPYFKDLVEKASYSKGSLRKKSRKELKKHNYNTIGIASVYGEIVSDYNAMGSLEGQMELSDLSADLGIFDIGRPLLKTTGCDRTGCTFCGYGCHLEKPKESRWEISKKLSNPNIVDFCMRGGAFDEDGLWKPDERGLGYWFVMKWINVHGNMKLHIPDYEKYEREYGTDETRKHLEITN